MAVEKGAVDFVAKPFEPRELVATLEKIIARDKE
jgi:DNA-binding response OmpR family regulator